MFWQLIKVHPDSFVRVDLLCIAVFSEGGKAFSGYMQEAAVIPSLVLIKSQREAMLFGVCYVFLDFGQFPRGPVIGSQVIVSALTVGKVSPVPFQFFAGSVSDVAQL